MAEVITTTYYSKYRSGNLSASGASGGWGRPAAITAIANAASNAQLTFDDWNSGGGATTDKIIGVQYGNRVETCNAPTQTGFVNDDNERWWTGTYTVTQKVFQKQTFVTFSIPNNLDVNTLSSVKLKIETNSEDYLTNNKYYIYIPTSSGTAPTASENTYYLSTNNNLDQNNKIYFTGNDTKGYTYEIDIKDLFILCAQRNKTWLLISRANNDKSSGYGRITNITIEYVIGITPCQPPTNFYIDNTSITSTIKKPSDSVHLFWSGAQNGVNNNIEKYRIYWKVGSEPVIGSADGLQEKEVVLGTTNGDLEISDILQNNRGNVFYFKIAAWGEELVNNAHLSDFCSIVIQVKVNSLPGAPTIVLNKNKVASTGGSIIVTTCSPGANNGDTSQTHTVKYSINNSNDKTNISKNGTIQVSNTATYKFWTYDGLEYSSTSTNIVVSKALKPTINSINLLPNSGSASSGSDVIIIKSTNNVTKDGDDTISYDWKIKYANNNSFSNSESVTISTSTNLSNFDVTTIQNSNLTFGYYYKLQLQITDNYTGEKSSVAESGTYYHINDIPNITLYNTSQTNEPYSNKNNTNPYQFEDYICIVFASSSLNFTKTLICNNSSTITNLPDLVNNIDIATTYKINRGVSCNFSIKFQYNNLVKIENSNNYTRAKDLEPSNFNLTALTKPKSYSQNSFTFTINQNITQWNSNDNLSGAGNYEFNFINGNNLISLYINDSVGPTTGNNGQSQFTLNLNNTNDSQHSIKPNDWKTFFNNVYPYGEKTVELQIICTSNFGVSFSKIFNVTLDFSENINTTQINCLTKIKTGNNEYISINDDTNYTTTNRYLIFPNQILQFTINNIHTYIQQKIKIKLIEGTTILKEEEITPSLYTTNANDFSFNITTTDFIIPSSLFSSKRNINFKISIEYTDLENTSQSIENDNLKLCKIADLNINDVIPKIKEYDENNGSPYLIYYCNFVTNGNESISTIFDTIIGTIKYQNNNSYSKYCDFNIAINNNSFNKYVTITTFGTAQITLTEDLYYFILKIKFNYKTVNLSVNSVLKTPIYYNNENYFEATVVNEPIIYTYYRSVPNLLYGKNFFVINSSHPKMNGNNEVADQLLVIRSTGAHNKIYFGKDDSHESNFEINEDYGLIIDGGSWD